ncbi:Carbonic anhydrase or acetyltransferase, isoleucine patch superfamily [Actinokineospora alba]|uniref:Carbonic anhydrase or acetyltransferase, isoleucine patch superfamily n=1 Tax=Actinokineospora alba TaxID=504798 RepID=A0A1H0I1B8_9PSEU|nr:gamma carbonic anhydrase family protein [Actinokineospora alba]TDP64652.1 carbonic anhydrase/acetyltransferase-like protein (isoleucine patch superfamily) [Actinokineospora alba]SDI84925.1 Carbonic anhydrase or acetyltransferase, isoleucine patch superfamily [Actinokineospora alba]SDO25164.1 Carbonic anhydrase or acetyltransferase, isoleucine patch superfamily [Actinokineospora alba]
MPVYALGDLTPTIHPDAYVHPDATVIGNVTLHAGASVWPQAVLRGDAGEIVVGERTSVQDGTVIHCTQFHPAIIGADCVIGHNVHIEGATVGDRCMIASGSVLLNGSVVEDGAILGAGAVMSFNGFIPARSMALGVPAKVREGHVVPEDMTSGIVEGYLQHAKTYRAGLRRLD